MEIRVGAVSHMSDPSKDGSLLECQKSQETVGIVTKYYRDLVSTLLSFKHNPAKALAGSLPDREAELNTTIHNLTANVKSTSKHHSHTNKLNTLLAGQNRDHEFCSEDMG